MHLIFDLDGTLIDSYPGVRFSIEKALRREIPTRHFGELEFRIGPPVREVMKNSSIDLNETQLDRLEKDFRQVYDLEGWRMNRPYPGVKQSLKILQEAGNCMYIVTYKPGLPTNKIIDQLGWANYFLEILSPDSRSPKFANKAECISYLLEKRQLEHSKAIYIGDTPGDMSAAMACGIAFLAIEYGYGPKPTQWAKNPIHHFPELFDHLNIDQNQPLKFHK